MRVLSAALSVLVVLFVGSLSTFPDDLRLSCSSGIAAGFTYGSARHPGLERATSERKTSQPISATRQHTIVGGLPLLGNSGQNAQGIVRYHGWRMPTTTVCSND